MNPDQAAYLCLVLAFLMSNLPFLGRRRAAPRPSAARPTYTSIRIMAWLLLYGAWIAMTMALERNMGAQVSKDWSIWPISVAFFAVLAFPGVVYHYLWRP